MGGSSAEAGSEFSRIVGPERLGARAIEERIEATAQERVLLQDRLGLLGLDCLSASCRIRSGLGGLVLVSCDWRAEVAQACVVTLDPVCQAVEGRLQASFLTSNHEAGQRSEAVQEIVVEPEGEDPPEPLPPAGIDLGELVVQDLAVSLDPYPRSEGAVLPTGFEAEDEGPADHPFAALKVLKGKE